MHETATIEHLASRLRWARGRLHLSQAEAAERFGVTPRTIGSWERGDTLPGSRLHKTLLDFIAEADKRTFRTVKCGTCGAGGGTIDEMLDACTCTRGTTAASEGAAQAALPPASEATR